ncbi:MAG: sulfotransferase domain-containing protein [Planctomycetales bacterium]|nr:sulfotransferase domain-containing protein [Planctomycetales bacterium]
MSDPLHHRNPFVRKGTAAVLKVAKRIARPAGPGELRTSPPVFANSFPKSGTHLLDQIVAATPNSRNYGEFLSSMTSSFQFRRRSPTQLAGAIRASRAGEVVRAHLFYSEEVSQALRDVNAVHFFIYRDPRDVVVSEANYLRDMNRWHRLHRHFARCASFEEAVALSIRGINGPSGGLYYPDVAQRFQDYAGWLACEDCCAVRFEGLTGADRDTLLHEMAGFYAAKCAAPPDVEHLTAGMRSAIAPQNSHTFRSGKSGGWRAVFTPELRDLFANTTGPLLRQLGYEQDDNWVTQKT